MLKPLSLLLISNLLSSIVHATRYARRRVGRGKILKNKEDAQMTKGVVYGFFDRKLRKMAPDVVKMLEDAKQWVDPNLKELCGGSKEKKEKGTRLQLPAAGTTAGG